MTKRGGISRSISNIYSNLLFILCILLCSSIVESKCASSKDCGVPPAFACLNETCQRCYSHNDCNNGTGLNIMRCITSGKCVEKNLFDHFDTIDIISSVGAFLATALATGGGIGGGGLLVPLYVFVVGLDVKHAIPLSKATIFGAAVATIFVNAKKRHPLAKNRSLIDWDIAALLEPPTLIGTIFGVIMNKSFPSWLVLVLLIILLIYTARKTFAKAMKLHAVEVRAQKGGNEGGELPKYAPVAKTEEISLVGDNAALEKMLQVEGNVWHPVALSTIGVAWIITFVSSYMKGGEGERSPIGISCGIPLYWIVTFLPIPFLAILTFMIGRHILWKYEHKLSIGYQFVKGDVSWNVRNASYYPVLCTLAGVASGLLGVGGGLVKGPIMLEMGMIPEVQTVTAGTMILFTSSSTTLQFLINGQFPGELKYDYVGWYIAMGFMGSFVGQHAVKYVVKKSGKASFLIFLLAALILVSGISLCATTSRKVYRDINSGQNLGFEPVCRD